ncbi:hypothetical protein AeMF1_004740 [Aphanomyces euteiches]|nr:hypothetical protein AeMF1_004740 [Aphanomyces euteiches]KAH9180904.1 hypothetical protein AeNC1_017120 [Aphanomyces euteiches]
MLTNDASLGTNNSTFEVAAATTSVLLGALLLRFVWSSRRFSHLPQPPPSSFLFGHAFDTLGSVANWKTSGNYPEPFLSWIQKYGGAIYYRTIFNHNVLLSDPVALQHVLVSNAANFPREDVSRSFFRDIVLGDGLFSAEGKQHDQYRKLLNPLFTTSVIGQKFTPRVTMNQDNGECDWDKCPGYSNVDMHFCKNGCPKRNHHVCAISMGNDEHLCILCSECLSRADDKRTGKEIHQRSQRSRNWSDEATIKLLHLRFGDETIRAMFNSTRYGHDQKNAWEYVAKKLGDYTGKQCKERVKTCISAYNKSTIPKTGNERTKAKSFFGVLGEYLHNEHGLRQACIVDVSQSETEAVMRSTTTVQMHSRQQVIGLFGGLQQKNKAMYQE